MRRLQEQGLTGEQLSERYEPYAHGTTASRGESICKDSEIHTLSASTQ